MFNTTALKCVPLRPGNSSAMARQLLPRSTSSVPASRGLEHGTAAAPTSGPNSCPPDYRQPPAYGFDDIDITPASALAQARADHAAYDKRRIERGNRKAKRKRKARATNRRRTIVLAAISVVFFIYILNTYFM